jgi:hypothetical protein
MLRMYKEGRVLSILMRVYPIPRNDRGHINVIWVLQSCTDPLYILPSSPNETFPTSSDCTYDIGNIKVEADVDVIEESAITLNTEADTGIKQVEITGDSIFVGTNAETDTVSDVCVCVLLDGGLGSSAGIATDYRLDGPGIESRCGVRFFAHVLTGPGAHPASCTTGTGSFPGVKRPGRGADHPNPPSAEVKNE